MLHCPACALCVWWRTGAVRCVMHSAGCPGVHRTALPFGDRRCVLHVVRCTHVAARHVGCCKSHPCTALHCRARRSALCSCCSESCCLERAGCSLTGACAPLQHTAVHLYRPACAAVLGASRIVSAHGPFAPEPNPPDKQTNNQTPVRVAVEHSRTSSNGLEAYAQLDVRTHPCARMARRQARHY
jgi:hypothetical protein